MLELSKRPCQLGAGINTRVERHGDENVPACDIPLLGVVLSSGDLSQFFAKRGAHEAIYDGESPRFPELSALTLEDKIEGVGLELVVNSKVKVNLQDAKLKGVTLEPKEGGATLMSCKVQVSGDNVPSIVGKLLDHLERTINVEISGGEAKKPKGAKQRELAINNVDHGETGPIPPKSKRGRKSQNGARAAH